MTTANEDLKKILFNIERLRNKLRLAVDEENLVLVTEIRDSLLDVILNNK